MTIEQIIRRVRVYDPDVDERLLRRAYEFAARVHQGQKRLSGEPYINHPLAAALELTSLEMDVASIAAALLHDVLEDSSVKYADLEFEFGPEIARLVDGVTKLKLPDFEGHVEAEASKLKVEQDSYSDEAGGRKRRSAESRRSAENLRKIFLAMARDFRVMVIKLADRLHNMKTLSALPPDRQKKIASETLHIFAPLAHRLGIWQFKWQLEDLAFKYLNPQEYEKVVKKVSKTRRKREPEVKRVIEIISARLQEAGIRAEVQGRLKHLYSIYQKMSKQELDIDQIYDLVAIRIIVDGNSDCYQALGIVHDEWIPIPDLFTDYIAKSKPNLYQSLHTKVIGPLKYPLEVQIRTWEMHRTAEFGVAAHWRYKDKVVDPKYEERLGKLRQQLFDWQADSKDDSEFLRSVSDELFEDQVFVFTPRGDVVDLPKGSTPIDLAYRIHTELGDHCARAKVNGRLVPLTYQFKNGDVVEITARANVSPSLDWLSFVKTSHARSKIKAYFRKLRYTESIAKGREVLEKEAERQGFDPQDLLKQENLQGVLESLNVHSVDDLLASIGYGHTPALTVIHKLTASRPQVDSLAISEKRLAGEQKLRIVAGDVDNVAVRLSKCCAPIPGDEVVGYVTRGRGITLHRRGCSNLASHMEKEPERLIEVEWHRSPGEQFPAAIRIDALDRVGLMGDIGAIFSEGKTNIISARVKSNPNKTASFELVVEVDCVEHLKGLMTRIDGLNDVLEVRRISVGKLMSGSP